MSKLKYIFFAILAISTLGFGSSAKAANSADFQAGRIIDDALFFDGNAMSVGSIQSFLSNKVPTCDVNGTQIFTGYYDGRDSNGVNHSPLPSPHTYTSGDNVKRANLDNRYPAPYTCLKDYLENSQTANSGVNGSAGNNMGKPGFVPSGCTVDANGINICSSAYIIYNAAQQYSISPKVLLVLIQKESALVTDDWPWPNEYKTATGFGCPDTAACDSTYFGFYNQVHSAARQYRLYANNPGNYNYLPSSQHTSSSNTDGHFNIPYNPSLSCGTDYVVIQNQATAGLYNYTPYTPNAAALNNLYGTGDSCSAYGNRNFWRLFTDWFGSTTVPNASIQLGSNLQVTQQASYYSGDTISGTYDIQNTASYDVDAGGFGVCARLNGANYDLGFIDHKTIPANSSVTINFSRQILGPGTLNIFICSYNQGMGGWVSDTYPYNTSTSSVRKATITLADNPLLQSGISLSPSNPAIGQTITATLVVKNMANTPVNIGSLIVAGRDPNGANIDFPEAANISVPANGTYTYSQSRTFSVPGASSFFVVNWRGAGYDRTYPKSADSTVVRTMGVQILDNPLISSGITLSPAAPSIGSPVTASMTFRNVSPSPINIASMVIYARDPSGKNVDFGIQNDVIVPANGTYTYSKTQTFSTPGQYTLGIAHWNNTWDTVYPKSLDSSVVRTTKVNVLDNPLVSSGISLSPANPTAGQTVTATMTIRNSSGSDINIGLMVVAARDPFGNNVDFAPDSNVVVPANGTYAYTKSRVFNASGMYSMFIANLQNNVWSKTYPTSLDSSIVRQISLAIN